MGLDQAPRQGTGTRGARQRPMSVRVRRCPVLHNGEEPSMFDIKTRIKEGVLDKASRKHHVLELGPRRRTPRCLPTSICVVGSICNPVPHSTSLRYVKTPMLFMGGLSRCGMSGSHGALVASAINMLQRTRDMVC